MSIILGIETSCDETAIGIVRNGKEILANEIYSQIDIHAVFGGVVPEIASRNHVEKIDWLVEKALESASLELSAIDAIAVTNRPGLVGALLVGVSFGKALAYGLQIPFIAVNHMNAHMNANDLLYDLPFPHIGLVVSGGHSQIYKVKSPIDAEVLGKTRDDAVGEVFDKVARSLGLGYPGGPKIDAMAKKGNINRVYPKAKLDHPLDFSFSGLKSAVLNDINQQKMKGLKLSLPDISASFQETAVDTLIEKAILACETENIYTLSLAGGVASNSRLREKLTHIATQKNIQLFMPTPILCTDNGAMVAANGYHLYKAKAFASLDVHAIPTGKL